MWKLDHKDGWVLKNWCFRIVLLKKTLKSPLASKEFKPINPKGKQAWIFTGRTGPEAEAPILWSPDVKNWLTGKDPTVGKDWRQKEKGWWRMTSLDSITDWMDMNLSQIWETVKVREAWHAAVHGIIKSRTQLSNWTTTLVPFIKKLKIQREREI